MAGPPLDLCERQQSSLGPLAPGAVQATAGGAEAGGSQQKIPEEAEDRDSNDVGPGKSLLRREDLVSPVLNIPGSRENYSCRAEASLKSIQ